MPKPKPLAMSEKSGELVALATKEAFNDLVRRAAAKGAETLSLIWKAGEIATQAKDAVPHGGWVAFVEQHYDVNHSTVTRWMQFRANVPESKLCTVHNLAAGIKMLEPPKAKPKAKPKPPRKGSATPDAPEPGQDYGKCPSCAGKKWTKSTEGVVCAKCNHPHGEPAGDVDGDRITTLRQKTVKTAEALIRAFDDLQVVKARPEYDEAIKRAKQLLAIAKGWR